MDGSEFSGGGGGGGIGAIIFLAIYLVFMLGFYIFFCICAKKICEKSGKDPGIMIWIPIAQIFPLMEVAGMETWKFFLIFIPFVGGLIFAVMLYLGLAKARNKNPGLAVALGLFCSIVFWPWMAFTD